MQILYDFFPILIFFIVYKISGIYAATASAIIVSFIQMIIFWIKHHKILTASYVNIMYNLIP